MYATTCVQGGGSGLGGMVKRLKTNVVLKLTRGGGPEPTLELKRVFEAAQEDPAGVTWIATRKPGSAFTARPDSQLLAFARERAGNALVLTARIISRHETLPSDTLVRDVYEDYKDAFRAYWKITDARLRKVSVDELPGTTVAGRSIADAFRGQLSFAYWLPDPPTERGAAPRPVPVLEFTPGRRSVIPLLPLHGVDFSGARETGGRNGKIWIASWYPDRDFVELRSGGADPGFDRVGLADQVIQGSGTWVIDFPFGPPAAVAAAAGWHSWHEYLAWCRSHFDPRALRDELRETMRRAGVPWSTKRNIDHALRTTWFPFFEQLYRQTIAGGRDVLGAVDQAGRDRTRILPFHDFGAANPRLSVVIEGFPGWTLAQCGLRGEDLESVSRELGITAARASQWRDQFLAAGQASLKSRAPDARDEANRRLQAKIGELLMENELLYAKVDQLEAAGPLARRRSRR